MKRTLLPLSVFILGIALVAAAIIRGDAEVALLLVFPIIHGGGLLLFSGVMLIFASFILFLVLYMKDVQRFRDETVVRNERESKWGGVIFIGPIPIILGKDSSVTEKMIYLALVITVILAVIYILILVI